MGNVMEIKHLCYRPIYKLGWFRMVTIDEMNIKILKMLEEDGRMTYKQIAEKLGRSESTVRDRIQNLENAGIIKGYTAVVDKTRIGWECDAVVLCNADPFSLNNALDKLSQHEHVDDILQISGDRRLLFRVRAKNSRELEEFITKQAMPLGLVNVDLRMVIGSAPSKVRELNGNGNCQPRFERNSNIKDGCARITHFPSRPSKELASELRPEQIR